MSKKVEREDYSPREGELFVHSLQYEAPTGVPDIDRSWGPLIDDKEIWRIAELLARTALADISDELIGAADRRPRGESDETPTDLDPLGVVQRLIGSAAASPHDESFRVIEPTDGS